MTTYARYWVSARRVELASVVVCAGLATVLWGVDLPTEVLRPDLAPEQMVQLLAPLLACAVLLALRPTTDPVTALAAVPALGRRSVWLGLVTVLAVAAAGGAAAVMPDGVAPGYLRNVAAYVGVGLTVATVSHVVALTVPWLWFAAAVTLGLSSDRGSADPAWWALPLHQVDLHLEVTAVLVAVGGCCWLLRRR